MRRHTSTNPECQSDYHDSWSMGKEGSALQWSLSGHHERLLNNESRRFRDMEYDSLQTKLFVIVKTN